VSHSRSGSAPEGVCVGYCKVRTALIIGRRCNPVRSHLSLSLSLSLYTQPTFPPSLFFSAVRERVRLPIPDIYPRRVRVRIAYDCVQSCVGSGGDEISREEIHRWAASVSDKLSASFRAIFSRDIFTYVRKLNCTGRKHTATLLRASPLLCPSSSPPRDSTKHNRSIIVDFSEQSSISFSSSRLSDMYMYVWYVFKTSLLFNALAWIV